MIDWEAVKLVGAVIGVVTGTVTLGEKLCGYTKRVYLHFKKENPYACAVLEELQKKRVV